MANDWLMRNTVRPAMATGLDLAASGFREPHPCFWSGEQYLLQKWDMQVKITQALGQIDQAGNALVSLSLRAGHSTGAFGLSATATIGLKVEVADDTLHIAVLEPKVSGVDLEIAWWVYVTAALFPGDPLVLLALGIADACAGGDAVAALVNALTGKLHIEEKDLPVPSIADLHLEPDDAPGRCRMAAGDRADRRGPAAAAGLARQRRGRAAVRTDVTVEPPPRALLRGPALRVLDDRVRAAPCGARAGRMSG